MNSRISFLVFMMLFLASSFSYAQKGKMEAGGAIKFDINTTNSSGLGYDFTGINGRFYYYLNDNFRLVPNISFNFPYKTTVNGVDAKATINSYNAHVHYVFDFIKVEGLDFYALGGVSYNHLNETDTYPGGRTVEATASDMALNLGGGLDYQIKPGKLFFEVQELFGDYKPLVIGFGIMIALN